MRRYRRNRSVHPNAARYSRSRVVAREADGARGVLFWMVAFAAVLSILLVSAGGVSARPLSGEAPTFKTDTDEEFASGKVIVKFEEDATRAEKADARGNEGLQEKENLGLIDAEVDTVRGQSVEQAVRDLEKRPDVEYAEPDFLLQPSQTTTANDPGYPKMYGLDNTGQTGGTADADIDAPEAWSTTTGGADTVVAVIDEGVDTNHPDLKNNVWTNPDEIAGNGADDDRNGYVDDVNGWDFANNDASVYDRDPVTGTGDEHGTHVAGTIAAQGNNSLGVVGVNWQAKIMPLKFIGANGSGNMSNAIKALDYAVKEGVKISNNSYGYSGAPSQSFADALARADTAGHLFVAAAGNGGADGIGDNNDAAAHYPSSYGNGNVVAVAATDGKDALASFSNYGASSVDVGAPGVGIRSTLPGNTYGSYSGTSMATPHVAGIAALVKSSAPSLDDAGIKAKLLQSAEAKPTLAGKTATGGRVNAASAMSLKVSELVLNANPSVLNYGVATALSGKLTSFGAPLVGKQVTLEQRPVGAASYSFVATVATDANGNYSKTGLVPTKNTDYRVRFAGEEVTGVLRPSEAVKRVGVKAIVLQSTPTTTLKLGQSRTVYGSLSPAHTSYVTLTIRRNGAVVATRNLTLTSSRYSLAYKPPSTGTYSFSVSYAGDADHLGNISLTRSFSVVR